MFPNFVDGGRQISNFSQIQISLLYPREGAGQENYGLILSRSFELIHKNVFSSNHHFAREERLQSSLLLSQQTTLDNYLSLSQTTVFEYHRQSQKSIVDHLRQLPLTFLDKHPRISQITILDFLRQASQNILDPIFD